MIVKSMPELSFTTFPPVVVTGSPSSLKETAWNFFAVPTTSNPRVSPSEQILALGPYLVREASVDHDTVSLIGDNANTTTLE